MVIPRTRVPLLVLLCLALVPAVARSARNAEGALIVHTDPTVAYTRSGNYGTTDYSAPASCRDARTRIDQGTGSEPALVWILAAFPNTSNPGVRVVQFGLTHTLSLDAFVDYEVCPSPDDAIDLPDDSTFPDNGSGVSIAFTNETMTERLFPIYWFALEGNPGDTFGTAVDSGPGKSVFVDDSDPPLEDEIRRFGHATWGSDGSNDCPVAAPSRQTSWGDVKAGFK